MNKALQRLTMHCLLWTGALWLLAGCGGGGASTVAEMGRVVEAELLSTEIGENYPLKIYLPPGYDDDPRRQYPMILALDSGFRWQGELRVVRELGLEAVFVGIGHEDQRARDYTPCTWPGQPTWPHGQAPRFYDFLAAELVPFILANYRIDPDGPKVLMGHSYGGLFTTYAFLQQDGSGAPFNAFLAASPSLWECRELFDAARIFVGERGADLSATLYMASGSEESTIANDQATMAPILEGITSPGFSMLALIHDGLDHDQNSLPSFREGLAYIFANPP